MNQTHPSANTSRVAASLSLYLCVAIIGQLAAEDSFGRGPPRRERAFTDLLGVPHYGGNMSGPLCGVYAACTALEMIGVKAEPGDFITVKYVGRCGGSSPEEVARIVEESGAQARIISRMSALDLRLIGHPLITNVRLNPAAKRFNHWVVAVPSRRGITVFDGLQNPYSVTTAEFLAVWGAT
ncbi:MAG TPA: hypothetical protein VFI31_03670 [Pirellulales bacterium]|nr:hypothetical protein [Pirellulales bacterium]